MCIGRFSEHPCLGAWRRAPSVLQCLSMALQHRRLIAALRDRRRDCRPRSHHRFGHRRNCRCCYGCHQSNCGYCCCAWHCPSCSCGLFRFGAYRCEAFRFGACRCEAFRFEAYRCGVNGYCASSFRHCSCQACYSLSRAPCPMDGARCPCSWFRDSLCRCCLVPACSGDGRPMRWRVPSCHWHSCRVLRSH